MRSKTASSSCLVPDGCALFSREPATDSCRVPSEPPWTHRLRTYFLFLEIETENPQIDNNVFWTQEFFLLAQQQLGSAYERVCVAGGLCIWVKVSLLTAVSNVHQSPVLAVPLETKAKRSFSQKLKTQTSHTPSPCLLLRSPSLLLSPSPFPLPPSLSSSLLQTTLCSEYEMRRTQQERLTFSFSSTTLHHVSDCGLQELFGVLGDKCQQLVSCPPIPFVDDLASSLVAL